MKNIIHEVLTYLEKHYPSLLDQPYRAALITYLEKQNISTDPKIAKERLVLLAKTHCDTTPCQVGAYRPDSQSGVSGAWVSIIDGREGPTIIASNYHEAVENIIAMRNSDNDHM